MKLQQHGYRLLEVINLKTLKVTYVVGRHSTVLSKHRTFEGAEKALKRINPRLTGVEKTRGTLCPECSQPLPRPKVKVRARHTTRHASCTPPCRWQAKITIPNPPPA